MERTRGKEMVGKVIVSGESGRKFGVVGDVNFITESGELMSVVIAEPTKAAMDMNLTEDDKGRLMIPFSAIRSVGEFVIIAEKDVI